MTDTASTVSQDHSLTLDEIVGFSAARYKVDHPESAIPESELTYIPYRVFINQLDSYHGKAISNVLCEQIYQEPKEETGEEAEEEEPEEDVDEATSKSPGKSAIPKQKLQIIGTVIDKKIQEIEDIKEIVDASDPEEFFSRINKCGFIIYDITGDSDQIQEALWVLQRLEKKLIDQQAAEPKAFSRNKEIRTFILISTIMTWAQTKPMDPEDPELAFQENDFRKRRAHPNYKEHIKCEKDVVKFGKSCNEKLKTIVIASGITYGLEQRALNLLFKMAWLGEPFDLPIFSTGKNIIPLIHVNDLVSIISGLILKPTDKAYILAVEQSPSKQSQIIKALAKTMGSGSYKKIPKEEAFLLEEITQEIYDRTTVHLNMEPGFIVSDLELQWKSDLNLVENIVEICKQYKEARKLEPIKIYMHGPPAAGKTLLAKRLCNYYKLHYLHVKDCIEFYTQEITNKINKITEMERIKEAEEAEKEDEEEGDDDEDEEEESVEDLQEKLNEVINNIAESDTKRLETMLVLKVLKQRLNSNACRNQGYVLDGFPKTLEHAKGLFEMGEDDEADNEEAGEESGGGPALNKKILPEYVISLEATDDFLCDRVMNLPEEQVQGTHYTEENMMRRLNDFRAINNENDTVLNFFDEIEIHPYIFSVMDDFDPEMEETFQQIVKIVGKPRNFGPSKKELEDMERAAEEQRIREEEEQRRVQEETEKRLKEEREEKMEKWADLMLNLQKEESELLAVQGEPLRNYLIKFVFPTLTKGLFEVARLKPDDPIDFLAEYLFRENPEGKMFDPAYTEVAGEFMDAVQKLQDVVQGKTSDLMVLKKNAKGS